MHKRKKEFCYPTFTNYECDEGINNVGYSSRRTGVRTEMNVITPMK